MNAKNEEKTKENESFFEKMPEVRRRTSGGKAHAPTLVSPLGDNGEHDALDVQHGRLHPIGHADLAEDPLQFRLHGLLRNAECCRDRDVRGSVAEQQQNLFLALRQVQKVRHWFFHDPLLET